MRIAFALVLSLAIPASYVAAQEEFPKPNCPEVTASIVWEEAAYRAESEARHTCHMKWNAAYKEYIDKRWAAKEAANRIEKEAAKAAEDLMKSSAKAAASSMIKDALNDRFGTALTETPTSDLLDRAAVKLERNTIVAGATSEPDDPALKILERVAQRAYNNPYSVSDHVAGPNAQGAIRAADNTLGQFDAAAAVTSSAFGDSSSISVSAATTWDSPKAEQSFNYVVDQARVEVQRKQEQADRAAQYQAEQTKRFLEERDQRIRRITEQQAQRAQREQTGSYGQNCRNADYTNVNLLFLNGLQAIAFVFCSFGIAVQSTLSVRGKLQWFDPVGGGADYQPILALNPTSSGGQPLSPRASLAM